MFDGAGFFFASRFCNIFTPQNMTMERLTQMLRRRLAARYEGGELDGVVRALCEDLLGRRAGAARDGCCPVQGLAPARDG